MDWLRRNWPDLLIGLALVAVIAGIVATLLTGGSFFPLGEGTTSAAVERGPSQEQSSATEPGPEGNGTADDAPADGPAAGTDGAATSGAATPAEDAGADASGEDGPSVAVLPAREGDQDASSPTAAPDDATQDGTAAEDRAAPQPLPVEEDTASPPESATPPGEDVAAADDATASESDPNAGLPTDPFRVSVGAFSSSENAERQATRFREEGYPVFVGAQGELTIVLVGPYQERARAEQVASEITEQHDDVEPVIYRYEPEGDAQDGATSVGAAQASVTSANADGEGLESSESSDPPEAAEPSDAVAAAPATDDSAAGAPVTLQVGAYATPDSAAPQVERLDGLGFHEVEQVRDGGLIRLMVGPYQGQALQDARALLDGAGIEYFPR